MLGPIAYNSFKFNTRSFLFMNISNFSNDNPSPDNASTIPPKSAKDKSFTSPGASLTLKFSIVKFVLLLFRS